MDFLKTQTNKTLEKLYPEQYLHLTCEQREEFYENLSDEETLNVKIQTTLDLGAGFNKIVINDDLRPANFMGKSTFSQLCSNILTLYSAENQVEPNSILPQPGVSIVLFTNPQYIDSFCVLQLFDLIGLLQTVLNVRLNYILNKRFPLTVNLRRIYDKRADGPFTEMEVKYVNIPDSKTAFDQQTADALNLKYLHAKELVTEYTKQIRFENIKDGFYYIFDEKEDALSKYFLNEAYIEEDEGMKSGWAVIQGEVDFDKNLFNGEENFESIITILEEYTKKADKWLENMLENVFVDLKNGW
ncbi:Conserved_hypothetical protein [Hexamita inflata]|uniref:Uncharacterized protein n=1 Tax=Hexamita inflata TaxID=28002 RepID=A0AA86UPJ4_9EUKA|nr:Conserved hypothetical protein [Hexamita inflata]